ncbi:MAG: DNA mismatch repair protein MutS [Acutalibacteraceae bacterium]|nr:DNA mismatch repair protein MutS [Acutalibacteraceae bacterium]
MAELSPMMKQYLQIKEQNKDCILFFRLGDFYEMFFDDAKLASKELELTLTGRDCGQEERAPMCGVPFHSSESYIARLVAKGYKVAICEQVEDPSKAKGLVKRDIIRVITPGTVTESSMLDEGVNNYICCVYTVDKNIGVCYCDISTGEFAGTFLKGDDVVALLKNELGKINPREILVGGDTVKFKELARFIKDKLSCGVELINDEKFDYELCKQITENRFGKQMTEELEEKHYYATVSASGALLDYLKITQKNGLERLREFVVYTDNQYMALDYNTRRNLELLETMRNKEKRGSLLWVLDKTKTSMGKRLIRSWIEQPLISCGAIIKRQNAVEELVNNTMLRLDIVEALQGILDMERLMTRIVYGTSNARELRSLACAIGKVPKLKAITQNVTSSLLTEIYNGIDVLTDVFENIDSAIVDEPPFSIREGGMIKNGYNQELDSIVADMNNSSDILAEIEAQEKEKTSIPKLKVGYNRVFGYYIEVPNSYKNLVPETYIRKQTLSNCERYITQDLKLVEGRILGAKEKSVALEYKLYEEVRAFVAGNLSRVQSTAQNIAKLDVLCSLACVASDNRYCKPDINVKGVLELKDSRHPVVEQLLKDTPFVPNDVVLDKQLNSTAIITGPNMAGKSTYMRQTALIVLMAQMGSFVPATSANVGIVDKIFTRVGASDDLASGQSTFMVEMNEVANIIKNATPDSLLILDEIGRGTSTFDGMSIARAVLEYVSDKRKLGAKTLFATHYHELAVMEELLDGVKNYNIAVKKNGENITFLRRIVPGGADKSYGIEVARLAGIPEWVIKRAKEIQREYENGTGENLNVVKKKQPKQNNDVAQISLLGNVADNEIISELKSTDLNTLTPIEAMNILYKLKAKADNM